MANDNETVEQVCAGIKTRIEELWEQSLGEMLNGEVDEFSDRILAAHKREMADEKRISDAVIQSLRNKKLEMDGEIARLNRKVYEYEKLLASSPIGLIYQLGICNPDGDVMNGIGILFTNEAERAKMPRVGHGDKFYVVPYKESEVPSF